ncbi:MAG: hypothetical protein OXB98_19510 [Bryobacterales bacterium]|nr:hypothetical protein [Bryobacterales bacterium]
MAHSKSSYIAASLGLRVGGAGADIALESAQVVLMSPRLKLLPHLIGTGRFCLRVIRQNVAIALGFKLLFLGLAAQNLATLWLVVAAHMGATMVGAGGHALGAGADGDDPAGVVEDRGTCESERAAGVPVAGRRLSR